MNKKTLKILQSIALILLGIWILSNPSMALVTIIRLIGIGIAISSFTILIMASKEEQGLSKSMHSIGGLLSLTVGIVFIASPQFIVSFFIVILGLLLLLGGLIGLSTALRRTGTWLHPNSIRNILLIVIALLMLIGPFESAGTIALIIGISSILYGVVVLTRS
jgi:uncharacterized membrane protein HdeD (DUF308 family)